MINPEVVVENEGIVLFESTVLELVWSHIAKMGWHIEDETRLKVYLSEERVLDESKEHTD